MGAVVRTFVGARERASDQIVRAFGVSEDFGEVVAEVESYAEPPAGSAGGRAHDLGESFQRVNRAYFADTMAMPRLAWCRTLTVRTLGHYRPARDALTIAAMLDDPGVGADVVDFVMYHELLHKKHGTTTVKRTAAGAHARVSGRRAALHPV